MAWHCDGGVGHNLAIHGGMALSAPHYPQSNRKPDELALRASRGGGMGLPLAPPSDVEPNRTLHRGVGPDMCALDHLWGPRPLGQDVHPLAPRASSQQPVAADGV